MIRLFLILSFFMFGQGDTPADTTALDSRDSVSVSVIRVEGAISPTTTNYIRRGIDNARENGSVCLIIEMDTPGGLLESTKNIVQTFFDSDIPIVVYVSPDGARAASAGTFITMAAHIAAMAPSTTIGAASPVSGSGAQMDSVMQNKVFNYSESFIESIAERRDRNKEWAISAVREGEAVTESEALELNVIDLIAEDRDDLLQQIDGRTVEGDTLRTTGATITEIPQNLAENLFGFIMRPEVMLILTMIAIYGIVGEVTNPGAIVPGVAGVIALILLLYASAAMPINIAGFVLIGLAIILFVAEAFTPTFGLLIAGGAVSFFLGALMLFQDLPESMELSWAWLVPATVLTTLFFVWIVTAGLKIQFSENRTGVETMIGQHAEVVDKVNSSGGRVFISGEYWNAYSDEEIEEGALAEVEEVKGLKMKVKPVSDITSSSRQS
ncbi:nodulation protein NfeD [Halalkalibaculum sp. DA3122]|uniref:NfeD family protein n=1 Tax=Halalkalibaculum sp. DA3122 TaxID=3373607 RepID=UPI0037553B67